jgi:hypothetical protein
MTDVPKRFKDDEELGGDELLEVVQAERRGSPRPQFERAEYAAYRADALGAAELHAEADASVPKALEEMSPDDHYEAIRGRRA